jgi:AcrR family transcriptional regulator
MGNREDTTDRILTAALDLLAIEGFSALGINPIARRAEADKQLIYRYFGGMEGLLSALGRKVAARLTAALGAEKPETYAAMAEELLLSLLRYLRQDGQYRQLRLMEVASPSPATEAFAQARGAALRDWMRQTASGLTPPPDLDVFALNAVLIAAVEGLAILGPAGVTGAEAEARQDAALTRLIRLAYVA